MGGRGREGRSRAKPGNQLVCYIIHSVHSKHCEAGTLETTIINSAVGAAGSHSV